MKKVLVLTALILTIFISTSRASAHEVYVLDHNEITADMQSPMPDFMDTINDHMGQFIKWGIIVAVIILAVFYLSVSTPIEKGLDPFLMKIKKYAPHIAQVTLGLAMLVSGYYHDLFGIELPIGHVFGSFENAVAIIFMIVGLMLIIGIYPRIAALITTAFFIALIIHIHTYMLNYFTYLGEALSVALFGGAHTLFANKKVKRFITKMIHPRYHQYKFLMMRVFFGISLIYASLYAKLFHGALALDVVNKYNLTHYFPFDPLFLVLGAMLIEILLGVFFIVGFEIRFTSIFFLVFLTMSLVFFGESVWPHIILIGTAITMFVHGYDRYTITMKMAKKMGGKRGMEPTF
jgi:uncharacterized membrane protein YphA (DoxX/SURF4 family)